MILRRFSNQKAWCIFLRFLFCQNKMLYVFCTQILNRFLRCGLRMRSVWWQDFTEVWMWLAGRKFISKRWFRIRQKKSCIWCQGTGGRTCLNHVWRRNVRREQTKNEVCQNVQQPAVLAWHATHFTCILSAHSVKQTYIVNMYTVTDTIIKEQH